MPRNKDLKDSSQHCRMIEFKESKFYTEDFEKKSFRFLTVYDKSENLVLEFAHLWVNNVGHYWTTPANDWLTCGNVITALVEACQKYGELILDMYVDDVFKSYPSISRKQIFRYRMTMGKKTRGRKGGSYIGGIEQLYNLEAVSDVKSFHELSQLF